MILAKNFLKDRFFDYFLWIASFVALTRNDESGAIRFWDIDSLFF